MGFLDNMKQLMEIKQKMEETKARLDTLTVDASNEYVRITVNGNRKVKDVVILQHADYATLEGKLQTAINEAMEKADALMQKEMMGVTQGMMPPGMG